ncbi:MAG: hypothetical protein MOGMAGMI_02597 [Candidatus Omnitrophica bacterium]|nr:hypothetical protein [Candidatus Omnitrophota bacterium]
MALSASSWEIQNDKDIRYIGTAHGTAGVNYVTVLELHRWLQDLADDASSTGDDYMDITRDTPSDKSFDTIINLVNSFNIDDTTAEYIYGGSIIQAGGDVIYDGVQVVANSACHVEIVQNGAIIANDFWNNDHAATGIKGINPDSANGISARFMVKVRTAAADIDGRKLLFQTREWGKTYSEFKVNGTGRGVNVVPLTYADDLNNTTASGTVATWTTITNVTAGYNGIDVNNDAADEYYYSEWNKDTYSINQFYERMKYLTRRGSAETLYGINGELFRGITHEVQLTTPRTGTFSANEAVSWTGGTGRMLAIDSTTAGTKMWIQLMTGVAPSASLTITGGTSSATATNTGTPTERALSFPFCGVSTGSAIIGAYGFGIEALALSASDKVFDLTNTQRQAPNYVTFTVGGLVSGEDYVLVAPNDGGAIDLDFFTLNGALSGAAVTSVVVNEAIPTWLPATGTIRIARANGAYTRHPYSAYNTGTKTFTITSHDFSSNNAANGANCYPTPIDVLASASTAAFTGIYPGSDVSLYIRVRDGGVTPIKTFESTGSLGSGGGSATAVRTSDA